MNGIAQLNAMMRKKIYNLFCAAGAKTGKDEHYAHDCSGPICTWS